MIGALPLRTALLLCAACLACGGKAEEQAPLRLVDRLPEGSWSVIEADAEARPVLPWTDIEQRIEVEGAPTRPILSFAVGLPRFQKPRAVRFEIFHQRGQEEPTPLYTRDVDRAGWIEERIDLSDRDLNGSTLIFRREVLRGYEERPPHGLWGNPMLLPASPAAGRLSVILVSLDTLRADMVGVYGRAEARTPALDRLAEEGMLYERAYAPSTWTLPSHASILYGDYLPATPASLRALNLSPVAAELPKRPIAEILRDAGYLTAGFTGGGYVGLPWDFYRGFDSYYMYLSSESEAADAPQRFDGAEVFRRATEWLKRTRGAPFFLFVHTYDAHDRSPFLGDESDDVASSLARADRGEVVAYYDELVAGVDRKLAGLLADLDALGLRDHTLVIVTSDHGEALGEHGQNGHGCDMKPYEELARVPLLVRLPGRVPAGQRISTPVSLVDILPSVLALLGLPREPASRGSALPGLGLEDARAPSQPVFSQCGTALAVWRGDHKLLSWYDARQPDEAYRLSADPGEKSDLGPAGAEARALGEDARAFWKTVHLDPTTPERKKLMPELDEAARQRLRDLGYLR